MKSSGYHISLFPLIFDHLMKVPSAEIAEMFQLSQENYLSRGFRVPNCLACDRFHIKPRPALPILPHVGKPVAKFPPACFSGESVSARTRGVRKGPEYCRCSHPNDPIKAVRRWKSKRNNLNCKFNIVSNDKIFFFIGRNREKTGREKRERERGTDWLIIYLGTLRVWREAETNTGSRMFAPPVGTRFSGTGTGSSIIFRQLRRKTRRNYGRSPFPGPGDLRPWAHP